MVVDNRGHFTIMSDPENAGGPSSDTIAAVAPTATPAAVSPSCTSPEEQRSNNDGSSRSEAEAGTKVVIATKVTGTVKWFNVKSGYGFINRNDTKEDVFVHQTAIVKNNPKKAVRSVGDGETVEFDVVVGEKGNEAANVAGPGGIPVKGSPYAADRRRGGFRRGGRGFYPRGGRGFKVSRKEDEEIMLEGDQGSVDGGPKDNRRGGRRFKPRFVRRGGGYRKPMNSETQEDEPWDENDHDDDGNRRYRGRPRGISRGFRGGFRGNYQTDYRGSFRGGRGGEGRGRYQWGFRGGPAGRPRRFRGRGGRGGRNANLEHTNGGESSA